MELEISAAISSLSAAMGLAKGALDARDDAKVKEAIMDMSTRLLAVHEAATKLAFENQGLQAELRKLQQQQLDEQRFRLHEIEPGRFALLFEPRNDEVTPAHYICQACFSMGKKVVLRSVESAYGGHSLICPMDSKHDLPLRNAGPLPVVGRTGIV